VVDEIYADQVRIGDGGMMPRDQFKTYAKMSITALPDLAVKIHDQIGKGDRVVTRWSADGTHLGDFMGRAATRKRVQIKAIHIHQVVEGMIATLWEEIDMSSVYRQLGIAMA